MKVEVGDIVKFHIPEWLRPSFAEVKRIYKITADLEFSLVGKPVYVCASINEKLQNSVDILDEHILEVYRRVDVEDALHDEIIRDGDGRECNVL